MGNKHPKKPKIIINTDDTKLHFLLGKEFNRGQFGELTEAFCWNKYLPVDIACKKIEIGKNIRDDDDDKEGKIQT